MANQMLTSLEQDVVFYLQSFRAPMATLGTALDDIRMKALVRSVDAPILRRLPGLFCFHACEKASEALILPSDWSVTSPGRLDPSSLWLPSSAGPAGSQASFELVEYVPQPFKTIGDLLPTADVLRMMAEVKVLFSFGSRNGGLALARELRHALLKRQGWKEENVYIDLENLKMHEDTVIEQRKNAKGETFDCVLNPHWAEFYYMGLLVTPVFILILDSGWTASQYCFGEWALFLQAAITSYISSKAPTKNKVDVKTEASDDGVAPDCAYEFNFVVVYDTSEGAGEALVLSKLTELGWPAERTREIVLIPAVVTRDCQRLGSMDGSRSAREAENTLLQVCEKESKHSLQEQIGDLPARHFFHYMYNKHFMKLALTLLNNGHWWTSDQEVRLD